MKLYVKAGDGRHVPLHPSDYSATSEGQFILKPEDAAIEVEDSPAIRRRIRCGDLVKVEGSAVPVAVPEAPAEIATAPIPTSPPMRPADLTERSTSDKGTRR